MDGLMRQLVTGFLVCLGLVAVGLIKSADPFGFTLLLVGGVFGFILLACIIVLGLKEGFGNFRGGKALRWAAWALLAVMVLGWIF